MRSVNIGHYYAVRIVERATKFLPQRFGARITMRLKHREHALAADRSRRIERGADFRRVMPVIVHQKKTRTVVFDFEPAARLADDRVLELHDALERLSSIEPIAAKIVETRLFAGLSMDETAAALGLSRATAYREWSFARAWPNSGSTGSPPAR